MHLKILLEDKVLGQMYLRTENLEIEGYLLKAINEMAESHKDILNQSAVPPSFLLEEVRLFPSCP